MTKFRKFTALVVLVANACYTAVPLTTERPPQGTVLIVSLTDAGSAQMASVLGPKSSGLSGKYLGESGDSLLLGVASVLQQSGNESFWQGERVGVPHSLIATLRERKASVTKSALIVGALVAVLVGITSVVSSGNPGQQGSPTPKGQ
ncbi:MAG: hypothetical protein M3Z17_00400 [Gemmatimonadota bacterium]|nr:hypothetical protein [Gemmatimonadota bacterium]